MSDQVLRRLLAPRLRGFFREHLPRERGLSENTSRSYRDAWKLLLRFGMEQRSLGPAERWTLAHVDRALVLAYLKDLEDRRGVTTRTRNLRLAAVHAFFRYLEGVEPDLDLHCRRILSIPVKRFRSGQVDFLEADELRAVLAGVTRETPEGRRLLAMMVFAYNTGARVSEIAGVLRDDLDEGPPRLVRLVGKGRKERTVPLWEGTWKLLHAYLRDDRPAPRGPCHAAYLFLGLRGTRLTRHHVGRLLAAPLRQAGTSNPRLARKRLTAHSYRHTTAVHLLQAGAELNIIRAWLGHASTETLRPYLDLDLRHKRDILEKLVTPVFSDLASEPGSTPSEDVSLLDWLDRL